MMNERSEKRWEKMRAKGKRHFVVNSGVLRWGLTTAVLYSIFVTYLNNGLTGILLNDFLRTLLIAVILFPIGGYFWGIWVWKWQEKNHRKEQ
ncbi:hypothetical protein [Paenibacillus glacialis]|nr:hypothetical protein [Paenibacillus glacialis]